MVLLIAVRYIIIITKALFDLRHPILYHPPPYTHRHESKNISTNPENLIEQKVQDRISGGIGFLFTGPSDKTIEEGLVISDGMLLRGTTEKRWPLGS